MTRQLVTPAPAAIVSKGNSRSSAVALGTGKRMDRVNTTAIATPRNTPSSSDQIQLRFIQVNWRLLANAQHHRAAAK